MITTGQHQDLMEHIQECVHNVKDPRPADSISAVLEELKFWTWLAEQCNINWQSEINY